MAVLVKPVAVSVVARVIREGMVPMVAVEQVAQVVLLELLALREHMLEDFLSPEHKVVRVLMVVVVRVDAAAVAAAVNGVPFVMMVVVTAAAVAAAVAREELEEPVVGVVEVVMEYT
jgi:hypothetical protein